MTFSPGGIATTRDDKPADVTVAGTAADLYLLLWNRADDDSAVNVTGDREVLDKWHGNHRVRWTS
jgi:predicted lipid carrier protein YhbT